MRTLRDLFQALVCNADIGADNMLMVRERRANPLDEVSWWIVLDVG